MRSAASPSVDEVPEPDALGVSMPTSAHASLNRSLSSSVTIVVSLGLNIRNERPRRSRSLANSHARSSFDG